MPFIKSRDMTEVITTLDIAKETTEENSTTQNLIDRVLDILRRNNE